MTPAFSPGPWSTYGALVGSVRSSGRECLYEQCSLHSALTIPSSVNVGSRPSMSTRRSYSSVVSPCSATSAGVICGIAWAGGDGHGVLVAGVVEGAGASVGGSSGIDGVASFGFSGRRHAIVATGPAARLRRAALAASFARDRRRRAARAGVVPRVGERKIASTTLSPLRARRDRSCRTASRTSSV